MGGGPWFVCTWHQRGSFVQVPFPACPSLAKHGKAGWHQKCSGFLWNPARNPGKLSLSWGWDGRKRENTYGIHRSEENLRRAEPQTLQPPQQKPPDGTTLNEEETPREASPKSKEACGPLSHSVFEGGNSRNPNQDEKSQGMQWALYSLPNHSSARSQWSNPNTVPVTSLHEFSLEHVVLLYLPHASLHLWVPTHVIFSSHSVRT